MKMIASEEEKDIQFIIDNYWQQELLICRKTKEELVPLTFL